MWNPQDPQLQQVPPWVHWHWLSGADIPLALSDSQEDSRRTQLDPVPKWEALRLVELERYHRQLFMWRLLQMHFKFNAVFGMIPFGCVQE